MPSQANTASRYRFTRIFVDDVSNPEQPPEYFGFREPLRYVADPGNEIYIVKDGDTLERIASQFFPGFVESGLAYWVLAEFQPQPIIDPTLRLKTGTLLVIPSPTLLSSLMASTSAAVFI